MRTCLFPSDGACRMSCVCRKASLQQRSAYKASALVKLVRPTQRIQHVFPSVSLRLHRPLPGLAAPKHSNSVCAAGPIFQIIDLPNYVIQSLDLIGPMFSNQLLIDLEYPLTHGLLGLVYPDKKAEVRHVESPWRTSRGSSTPWRSILLSWVSSISLSSECRQTGQLLCTAAAECVFNSGQPLPSVADFCCPASPMGSQSYFCGFRKTT